MVKHFKLTEAEAGETIPSGSLKIRHRTGWAFTFLTKAGGPESCEILGPRPYKAA